MTTAYIKYACNDLGCLFKTKHVLSIKCLDKIIVDYYINEKMDEKIAPKLEHFFFKDKLIQIHSLYKVVKNTKNQYIYDSSDPIYHLQNHRFDRSLLKDIIITNFNNIFELFEIPYELIYYNDKNKINTSIKSKNYSIMYTPRLDVMPYPVISHYIFYYVLHKNDQTYLTFKDDCSREPSRIVRKYDFSKDINDYVNADNIHDFIDFDYNEFYKEYLRPFLICVQKEEIKSDYNFLFGSGIFNNIWIYLLIIIVIIILIIIIIKIKPIKIFDS
jgi:hypothetical protein